MKKLARADHGQALLRPDAVLVKGRAGPEGAASRALGPVDDRAIPRLLGKFRAQIPLFDLHAMVDRFNQTNGTGIRLARPRVTDALIRTMVPREDIFGEVLERYPHFPTIAAIVYEKAGVRFSAEVVFDYVEFDSKRPRDAGHSPPGPKIVFTVPPAFRGESGIALVIPELVIADFDKGRNEVRLQVPEDRIVVVRDFPAQDGWYVPDPRTGVPQGAKQESRWRSREAKSLSRVGGRGSLIDKEEGAYVGSLASGIIIAWPSGDLCLGAYYAPYSETWVVVEVPEKDIAKFEAAMAREPARAKYATLRGPDRHLLAD